MKAWNTQECICKLVAVAFGNESLDRKALNDAVCRADDELKELSKLSSFREPKKVEFKDCEVINGGLIFTVNEPECPVCSESVELGMRYCASCGQALDWSEANDN